MRHCKHNVCKYYYHASQFTFLSVLHALYLAGIRIEQKRSTVMQKTV